MAYTAYPNAAAVSSGSTHTKGAYVQVTAATPYDSSRLYLYVVTSDAQSRHFLVDVATGAASAETVIVANVAVASGSALTVIGEVIQIDVDIPAGSRLAVRCQAAGATQTVNIVVYLEDRAVASLANPVTYGAVTASTRGTSVDPGTTALTKGAYVQLSASTTARIDVLLCCFTTIAPGTNIAVFQTWFVDVATGAASAETIVIPDIRVDVSSFDDYVKPVFLRLPISIPASTRVAVRCSCSVNTATLRLLAVTLIGMQEPSAPSGAGERSVAYLG